MDDMCGEAPIESSKEDPEGVFFFFSLSLSLRQETKKKAAQVISFVQIFLPPSTDLPTRYSTTRNSFIDGDESDKACRLGLSSRKLLFFFLFIRGNVLWIRLFSASFDDGFSFWLVPSIIILPNNWRNIFVLR